MSLDLKVDLNAEELETLKTIPAEAWFTQVKFNNAISPRHPEAQDLDANHEMKQTLVSTWIKELVPGKRVLDLFCANGAFAFEASLAGAREVVGLEFNQGRVDCANFVSRAFSRTKYAAPTFVAGNVYKMDELFKEKFDVVMCLGGLYHIPDPPFILTQIRAVTAEHLILQTSGVLDGTGSWAKFIVREDKQKKGLSSIVGGKGAWKFTQECLENWLLHADFKIEDNKRPSLLKRSRFPWYCAIAKPIQRLGSN